MKQFIFVAILYITLAACNSGNEQKSTGPVPETYIHTIDSLEQILHTQQTIDYKTGASMVAAYLNFANTFQKDSRSADYLFKAGDVSMNLKQSDKAIELFKRVVDFFPNYKKVGFALFLQGFIYETQLHDFAKAKDVYNQVIKDYPNTKMAQDAHASITNLGKSDEELIKEFEKKNKK